jgi:hypothetical protein
VDPTTRESWTIFEWAPYVSETTIAGVYEF